MLLLVIGALLGAYVGLTRRAKLIAVLTSGALTACLYAGGVILADLVQGSGSQVGPWIERASGDTLFTPVATAMAVASVCGLISASQDTKRTGLYLADDGNWRPERRKRPRPSHRDVSAGGQGKSFSEMFNR